MTLNNLRYGITVMEFEHILEEVEVFAKPFSICELRGSSRLSFNQQAGSIFHYILAGRGELITADSAPIEIGPGTLALVPTCKSHMLRGLEGSQHYLAQCQPVKMDLLHLFGDAELDGQGGLLAICSHIEIGFRNTQGLVNLLRKPILKKPAVESSIYRAIEHILAELSDPKLGSKAIVRTILHACILELLRDQILSGKPGFGWMLALKDDGLWAALQVMLENPAASHSVESLAQIAGMSRSVFAERFTKVYGEGPMTLLHELRMARAADLLENSRLTIERIAERSGFRSRSAFSRAFKTSFDLSPSAFRAQF